MHAPAGLRGKLQRACKGPAQRDPLNAGMPRLHVVPSPSQPKSSFLSFSPEEAISCSGRLPSMLSRMNIALGFWLREAKIALLGRQAVADWGS